mmetsp:Transcript_24635/g.43722  ORF Transcript_24635/g.43722 Transcript_24635/m.43722 type:complete len:103 (+) Transcript_24635:834-1142(+)
MAYQRKNPLGEGGARSLVRRNLQKFFPYYLTHFLLSSRSTDKNISCNSIAPGKKKYLINEHEKFVVPWLDLYGMTRWSPEEFDRQIGKDLTMLTRESRTTEL